MRKEITLLILLYFIKIKSSEDIYCSHATTDCTSYPSENSGFSCHPFYSFGNYASCVDYPDNEKSQRQYFHISRGLNLERFTTSVSYGDYMNETVVALPVIGFYEKETYKKGEDIRWNTYYLTDYDKKVFVSKNNCYYHFRRKFEELALKKDKREELAKEISVSSLSIHDENICFNADKFSDNKNLIDCGLSNLDIIIDDDEIYNLTTCFYIPKSHISEELNQVIKKEYEGMINDTVNIVKYFRSQIRNLKNDDIKYQMTVKGKNGRKIRYSTDKKEFEVLENGIEDDYDDDDDIIRFTGIDHYYYSTFNIYIILSLLTLLLL